MLAPSGFWQPCIYFILIFSDLLVVLSSPLFFTSLCSLQTFFLNFPHIFSLPIISISIFTMFYSPLFTTYKFSCFFLLLSFASFINFTPSFFGIIFSFGFKSLVERCYIDHMTSVSPQVCDVMSDAGSQGDGYSTVINLLVSHGAHVNAQDSNGYTVGCTHAHIHVRTHCSYKSLAAL